MKCFVIFSVILTSQIYANEFKVGFAELSITPKLIDEWEDMNDDAQFDPDVDKWTDVNGRLHQSTYQHLDQIERRHSYLPIHQ